MRIALFTILALSIPTTATAQANQTSRTITDDAGRRVTCTVGQIGQQKTRGVAIFGRSGSIIDAEPSDARWRSSGCEAEMSMTPEQRRDRVRALLEAGPVGLRRPEPRTTAGPSLGGAVYVANDGDTATGISRRFSVGLREIEAANHQTMRGSRPLEAGTRLTLPANAVDTGINPHATSRNIVTAQTN